MTIVIKIADCAKSFRLKREGEWEKDGSQLTLLRCGLNTVLRNLTRSLVLANK